MSDCLGPYPLDTVVCGDAVALLREVPTASVDLGIADPPYFQVAEGEWDHQWATVEAWADWCRVWAGELCRVLKDNGSAYLFGDEKNIAYMQVRTDKLPWGLLNCIVWSKTNYTMLKADPNAMRSYRPQGEERILFYGKDRCGWSDNLPGIAFAPLREYLRQEILRSGLTTEQIGKHCDVSGRMIGHYIGESQWELPTQSRYEQMQQYLNTQGLNPNGSGEYLRRDYEELRRDYEYLRRDYEELRRDYEELRRPFTGGQFTDVWTGPLMPGSQKQHDCEKPQWLVRRMVEHSSKPGATVLDLFAGSASVGEACKQLGRRYLGFELNEDDTAHGNRRLSLTQPAWPEMTLALQATMEGL